MQDRATFSAMDKWFSGMKNLSEKNIIWLTELRESDQTYVGGKAANLGELHHLGLASPLGFCVTTKAYQLFLRNAEQVPILVNGPDKSRVYASQMYPAPEQIRNAPWPPDLLDEIRKAYRQLCNLPDSEHICRVAVRSSALGEDSSYASHAGQYDTFLDVSSEQEMLDCIRQCWCSLWTPRAVSYRNQAGVESPLGGAMAVVIQQMVPASTAGVLFTIDPMNGKSTEMLIEAVCGLGENLVSGAANPWRYRIDKSDGSIVAWQAPPDRDVDFTQSPVAASLLARLCEIGRLVENHYGVAQDIEWAIKDGGIYVLQTRPVVTPTYVRGRENLVPDESDGEGDMDWTDALLKERFPQPLHPLGFSVVKTWFVDTAIPYAFRSLGLSLPEDAPLLKSIRGRPFLNRSILSHAANQLPIQGLVDSLLQQKPLQLQVKLTPRRLQFIYRLVRAARNSYSAWKAFLPVFQQKAEIFNQRQFTGLSPADLDGDLDQIGSLIKEAFQYHILHIVMADAFYQATCELAARWAGPQASRLSTRLFLTSSQSKTLETNTQLLRLAQKAGQSPQIRQIFQDHRSDDILSILYSVQDASDFVAELDQFLAIYGHRAPHYDPVLPAWREDPTQVLSILKNYLNTQEPLDIQDNRRAQYRIQMQAEKQMRAALSSGIGVLLPVRWLVFYQVLRAARIFMQLRDDRQFYQNMLWPSFRRICYAIGELLFVRDQLENPQDIHFLFIDEIQSILAEPTHQTNLRSLVDARRAGFTAYCRAFSPPPEGEQMILQGIGGSPGRKVGPACVIRHESEFERMQSGDVLVAPSTNPAWTPLFPLACAIITETGGVLSHGAIVAREYGIPAVLGVVDATGLIKDGEGITVDGDEGLVYLATNIRQRAGSTHHSEK